MYIPIKLIAKNFLSFKELEYDFHQKKAILIQGVNFTDEGAKSNGSGKSSFQEMVYFLYIGDTSKSSPCTVKKLICRGEDEAEVTIILQNGDDILEIKRNIFQKATSTLVIKKNGENIPFASVNDGNKLLRDIIGITLEDLKNFFLVSRDTYKSFFRLSDQDKKDFIARFANTSKLKQIYPIIQGEIDKLNNDLQIQKNECIRIESKFLSTQDTIQQLEDSKKEQEGLKIAQITELNNSIKELLLSQQDYENKIKECEKISYEKDIEKISNLISIFKDRLQFLDKISFEDDIAKIKVLLKDTEKYLAETKLNISEQEESKNEISKAIRELDNLLQTAIECPKCKHRFSLQDENFNEQQMLEEKAELYNAILEISEVIKEYAKTKKELNDKIVNFEADIKRFTLKDAQKTKLIRQTNRDLTKVYEEEKKWKGLKCENSEQINKLLNKIKFTKDDIRFNEKRIIEIEQFDPYEKINTLLQSKEGELEKLKEELSEIQKKIQQIEGELINKNKWLLDFRRFYSYLSNHSLRIIEFRTNDFLQKMKTNLSCQIEGFKLLASGEVREQITCNILRDGMVEGNFSEFSAGERGKLECAMILACQQLVNESVILNSGLDLLMIDEVLDSIDGEGMVNIIKSLSHVNKTIFLTSHITVEEVLSNDTLIVEKINGVSSIRN